MRRNSFPNKNTVFNTVMNQNVLLAGMRGGKKYFLDVMWTHPTCCEISYEAYEGAVYVILNVLCGSDNEV